MQQYMAPNKNEPIVRVWQVSRKKWQIELFSNSKKLFSEGVWWRRTEVAAEIKAQKVLARYNRKYGDLSAGFTVQ